jgi:hypothetical protein
MQRLSDWAGGRELKVFQPIDTVTLDFESWAAAAAGEGTYRFNYRERISNVAVLEALAKSTQTGLPERVDN